MNERSFIIKTTVSIQNESHSIFQNNARTMESEEQETRRYGNLLGKL